MTSTRLLLSSSLLSILASLGLVACGGSSSSGTDGGSQPECRTNDDCDGGKVCSVLGTCEAPGQPCTDQSDCTGGTYCDPDAHVCLPSAPGTPCAGADNCDGECVAGFCGCDGLAYDRSLEGGNLDAYLVLDRTGSMGTDCAYVHGDSPPVNSKACSATYALSDYLIDVTPAADTRLAFQFMSQPNDCNGVPYETPLADLTQLPLAQNDPIIEAISDEDFSGGLGTHIEGALRGIMAWTNDHKVDGREMIGVLVTDGDPNGCEQDIDTLAQLITDNRNGIRLFIIGMTGATEENLETLAIAGGADPHDDFCGGLTPPCHFWSVGNGSGDAFESALQAISQQATPLPCDLDVTGLTAPDGSEVDWGTVNVTLTQDGTPMSIPHVDSAAACPASDPAWYYDDPADPSVVTLCPAACDLATAAGDGAQLSLVVGCSSTIEVE